MPESLERRVTIAGSALAVLAVIALLVLGFAAGGDATETPPIADAPAVTTTTTMPTGPIISIDDPRLTAGQRDAASDLIERSAAAMATFQTEDDVVAAGYRSIGDGVTGFEHFVSWDYLFDDVELDPARVESIVFRVEGETKTLVSAMFILPVGRTMADAPDIAGELTTWHDHQNLCWENGQVVGLLGADGTCPRGNFLPTPPMLHVWVTEHPCGPFAGIEGSHGESCHEHSS